MRKCPGERPFGRQKCELGYVIVVLCPVNTTCKSENCKMDLAP
jgi:hypothetical protein